MARKERGIEHHCISPLWASTTWNSWIRSRFVAWESSIRSQSPRVPTVEKARSRRSEAKSSQAARNSRLSAARRSASRRRQAGSTFRNVYLTKWRSGIRGFQCRRARSAGDLLAQCLDVLAALGDQALRVALEAAQIRLSGVVKGIRGVAELGLEAAVAPAAERRGLEVDGVGDAVEDHVEDRPGPPDLAPAFGLLVLDRARVRPGAQRRDDADVGARGDHLGVGAHRRIDGEHAAVDERVGAGAGRVGDLDG